MQLTAKALAEAKAALANAKLNNLLLTIAETAKGELEVTKAHDA